MICALMIGRAGSKGFPNKNIADVLGKKLCEYPILAAKNSKNIDQIYISTDCPKIKQVGQRYNVNIIDRPKNLATSEALGEDVFRHGYLFIKDLLNSKSKKIEMMVLLLSFLLSMLILTTTGVLTWSSVTFRRLLAAL